MARTRDYAREYLKDPSIIEGYLKYLKKTKGKYQHENAKVAKKLERILTDLRQEDLDYLIEYSNAPEVEELLSDLNFACEKSSWCRFLNHRNKRTREACKEKKLKKFDRIEANKLKRELRYQSLEAKTENDRDNIESLRQNISLFVSSHRDLPVTKDDDLLRLLVSVFIDLDQQEAGDLTIEMGPKEQEAAVQWIKRMAKLMAMALNASR